MERTRAPAPRPATWQWLAAGGLVVVSIAAGVTSEVIADQFGSDLGVLAWIVAGLASVGAVSLAVLANRTRSALGEAHVPEVDVPESGPLANDLPPADGFIGRADDVASVLAALQSRHAVAVVGRRGVGTSTCTLAVADRFRADADRVVYLNLRYQGRPMRPRAVLVRLAQVLHSPLPRGRSREALRVAADALWNRLNEQRILLVLDNVDSPRQVAHLLPPRGQDSRLLLAGGPALAGLEQAAVHRLTEPTVAEAVELFAKPGARPLMSAEADPPSEPDVREVVELCGRQPRAVLALGYRAFDRGVSARDLRSELSDAVAVAPHQHLPYSPVVGVLTNQDVAYHALSRTGQRVCRRLSMVPGALDHAAIAALTGLSTRQVERVLGELALAGFIRAEPGERAQPGERYALRRSLTRYANLHLHLAEPRRRRTAAYRALLRHLAREAERHVTNLGGPNPPGARGLASGEDPRAWFGRHQDVLENLVTQAATGWPLPGPVRRWWFRLAVALCGWYAHTWNLERWAGVCQTVLAVASTGPIPRRGRAGPEHPRIVRWARNELGVARRRQGQLLEAEKVLQGAVAQRGRRGAAQSHLNLGLVLLDRARAGKPDRLDEAVNHLELAWRYRTRGDRLGRAVTELALGAAYLHRDDADDAERAHHHLLRAANAFRALDSRRGFAAAMNSLGLAQWRLGEYLDATHSWTVALESYESSGDLRGKAAVLLNHGAALLTDVERTGGPSDPEAPQRARARAQRAYEMLEQGLRLRKDWPRTAGLDLTLHHLRDAEQRMSTSD